MIALTGCTTIPAPAPTPLMSAVTPQPAPSTLSLSPEDRAAARRVAVATMRDYVQTQRHPRTWWTALEPHLSAAARKDYAGTDPATIGAGRLTGPATVTPASLPALARVAVPTDTGSYLLLLSPHPGQQWAVERILPPETVS